MMNQQSFVMNKIINTYLSPKYREAFFKHPVDSFRGSQIFMISYKNIKGDHQKNLNSDDLCLKSSTTDQFRLLNYNDLIWIKRRLRDFLLSKVHLEYKILWVIKNTELSVMDLSRSLGINHSQVYRWRNNPSKARNMSLVNADKIDDLYRHIINVKLL